MSRCFSSIRAPSQPSVTDGSEAHEDDGDSKGSCTGMCAGGIGSSGSDVAGGDVAGGAARAEFVLIRGVRALHVIVGECRVDSFLTTSTSAQYEGRHPTLEHF